MAGVRQHGWRAIPAVRSEYGADTLPDRYRSDGRCRSARTAVHHARRRDRYRRTHNFSFRDRLFHSDGTVADVRSIFPLTRGQASRDLRCRALSDGMVPVLQRCSHILYRLFLPVLCGSLSEHYSPVP